MRFEKWQALGNDYIVLEHDALPFELTAPRIRKLCEAHFGVGSDGILLLGKPGPDDTAAGSASDRDDVVARLEIYNPDGSRAELSGNGAREAILYLRHRGWTDADEFAIRTDAGVLRPRILGPDMCRVDMGSASLVSKDYPGGPANGVGEIDVGELEVGEGSWRFRHVSIGNPQCAIAIDDVKQLERLALPAIGPLIEGDLLRFPNRTNVSWYSELTPAEGGRRSRVRARIFERGVGETHSSGTGACGAAIAYVLDGGVPPVEVSLDGGELLVEVGQDLHVHLTGWARPVFSGRLSDQFIEELHETE
jgi:diaminopimelate epimerase